MITRRGLIAGIGAAAAGYALTKSGLYVPEECVGILCSCKCSECETWWRENPPPTEKTEPPLPRYWQVPTKLERPAPYYGFTLRRLDGGWTLTS